ncbi:hypothetical protein [Rhodoligotrophos ferricapiens]|uniref:hypothetical protein n=1 Tax=Rhodoligotrophos ferricapiens TaxID=3069264 RepID=UPI00315D4CA7
MKQYVLALALALLLAGCGGPTLRDEPPVASWVAKRPFKASIACVVGALDRAFEQSSPAGLPILHRVSIQEPNVIAKVAPLYGDNLIGPLRPYWVRLMVLSQGETVVDLYVFPEWEGPVLAALRPCF